MSGIRVVPPNGWSFPSDGKLGSTASPHTEPGYEELIAWLRGYRIANGIEVGEPEKDINAATFARSPRLYGVTPSPDPYDPTQVIPKTFREEVTNWLSSMFQSGVKGPLEFIDEDESDKRAKICSQCPQNQNWKTGCPTCVENGERVSVLLSGNRQTSYHAQLMGCQVFKHDNTVATVLGASQLSKVGIELAPDFCWMRSNTS